MRRWLYSIDLNWRPFSLKQLSVFWKKKLFLQLVLVFCFFIWKVFEIGEERDYPSFAPRFWNREGMFITTIFKNRKLIYWVFFSSNLWAQITSQASIHKMLFDDNFWYKYKWNINFLLFNICSSASINNSNFSHCRIYLS